MPAILTHYTFTKLYLNSNNVQNKYEDLILLASQGPDLFFFYKRYNPFSKDAKDITNFGSFLHSIDISEFYIRLIDYASLIEDKKLQEVLFSYIKGLIFHYCLDRNAHPYIFYRTGIGKDRWDEFDYTLSHMAFETLLDKDVSEVYNIVKHPLQALKCEKWMVKEVSKMICIVSKDFFKDSKLKERSFYKSYKSMKIVERILYSRFGIKKWLYKKLIKNNVINVMSMPYKREYLEIDTLNISKRTYRDCVTGQEYNYSFDEIMKNAKKDAKYIDELLDLILINKKEDYKNCIKQFVNNISHDGFEVSAHKKYYETCWDINKS